MDNRQQKKNAKEFAEYWKGKGYEKGQTQTYWNMLLRDVFGVEKPESLIEYEDKVALDTSTGFMDGIISSSKVLIEQKSIDKDLNKEIKQSDGTFLTPYEQAKKYIMNLPVSQHPRWVITCNFKEFNVYDMENPRGEPEVIYLQDLPKEYYRLSFIVDSENPHIKKETELSLKAGEIVGELYDAFSKQYHNIDTDAHEQKSLNKLCVRIVFCLYAEDADLFKSKNQFHDYLSAYEPRGLRQALLDLFKVLNTPEDQRDGLYVMDDVKSFPYVNGGLFADDDIEIPLLTQDIKDILLAKASDEFNWSEISPTIFGAVFESTLNPETRRSGGMHYTSIENIHRVIDPLFLNELKEELEEIKKLTQLKSIMDRVKKYQEKLSSLVFMDPACGSGNFLTETYICLRRLENEALKLQQQGQTTLFDPIRVSIAQFLGIEINDFAVSVAQTALWIAESQMMRETEELFNIDLDFLPLKTNAGIIEGNALTMDWKTVFANDKIDYLMGNPPFIGANQLKEKRDDMYTIFGKDFDGVGLLDYVTAWYKKTAEFIDNTDTKCAFVSTNSITQGEQPGILWTALKEYDIVINFAYRTFVWDSEANDKAQVHVVIIGFSNKRAEYKVKRIYEGEKFKIAKSINEYLIDGPFALIRRREKAFNNYPYIGVGNMPYDGGHLLLTQEERDLILKECPSSEKYIRKVIGSKEFLNNIPRYCLWLVDATPKEISSMPPVLERVESVRNARLNMKDSGAHKLANTPTLFREQRNPKRAIVIPKVSSERRNYIPMDIVDDSVIIIDSLQMLVDGDIVLFGLLESSVHMSWMRVVGGRLKSDYRYSAKIVYNNFPWPILNDEQKRKIENTAQGILDSRKKYPDSTLADMYGEHMYLYPDLLKAHLENDKAVKEVYGFNKEDITESEMVAELMKMYQKLLEKE